ncbi:hypothetical protein AB7849_15350 [Rhodanobacter sp. 115]|uniref:hypothetical protein n=1 Tax=Rhodanobacter sp. FW021-MT20 TaxID=1162282 RepID=UPI0034E61BA3
MSFEADFAATRAVIHRKMVDLGVVLALAIAGTRLWRPCARYLVAYVATGLPPQGGMRRPGRLALARVQLALGVFAILYQAPVLTLFGLLVFLYWIAVAVLWLADLIRPLI